MTDDAFVFGGELNVKVSNIYKDKGLLMSIKLVILRKQKIIGETMR